MKKFSKDGRLLKKGKKIYLNGDIYQGMSNSIVINHLIFSYLSFYKCIYKIGYFAGGLRHGSGKLGFEKEFSKFFLDQIILSFMFFLALWGFVVTSSEVYEGEFSDNYYHGEGLFCLLCEIELISLFFLGILSFKHFVLNSIHFTKVGQNNSKLKIKNDI